MKVKNDESIDCIIDSTSSDGGIEREEPSYPLTPGAYEEGNGSS
jgi:hypothetical protein